MKELIREGNICKNSIHDIASKEAIGFPLTPGEVETMVAPILAAFRSPAALIGDCTITMEREEHILS